MKNLTYFKLEKEIKPSKVGDLWRCSHCNYFYRKPNITTIKGGFKICSGCHFSCRHGAVPVEEL